MAHTVWGVIIAAGKGEQLTPEADVAFLNLGTSPVLTYSMVAFEKCPEVDGVIVVARKERLDSVKGLVQMFGITKVQKLVSGSNFRHSCVQAALKALDGEASIIVIQEVSRPCVSAELISETIKSAKRYGTGVAAAKLSGTIKYTEKGKKVSQSFDGDSLWQVQSPQAFRTDLLDHALQSTSSKRASVEDEAKAFDMINKEVHLVPVAGHNMKIKNVDDLSVITALSKIS